MEHQEGIWRLGDLKCLRDEDYGVHKNVESIVLAGKSEDCFHMEQIIKRLNPTKKVIPVTTSDELLGMLHFYIPDLLIMDMEMPCRKGVQCLKQIREDRNYDELPIAVFSGTHRPSNKQVAFELGADYFFQKPDDDSELWDAMIRIITREWSRKGKNDHLRTA